MSAHPFAESNRAAAVRRLRLVAGYLEDASRELYAHVGKPAPLRLAELIGAIDFLVQSAITDLGRADEIDRMSDADTLPMPPESGVKEAAR